MLAGVRRSMSPGRLRYEVSVLAAGTDFDGAEFFLKISG